MPSFDELHDDLCKTRTWIESFGITVAGTRLATYQRLLETICADEREKTLASFKGDPAKYYNALDETMNLVEIYQALQSHDGPKFQQRLRDYVKGPDFARDENPSRSTNDPRNKGFELSFASVLARAGIDSVDLEVDGDLSFRTGSTNIFVECKRPQSKANMRKRVKGAITKLRSRFTAAVGVTGARGLVGISVEKLLNPQGSVIAIHSSRKDASRLLRWNLEEFSKRYRDHWLSKSPKVLGTLLVFPALFIVNEDELTRGVEMLLSTASPARPQDQATLDAINKQLGGLAEF